MSSESASQNHKITAIIRQSRQRQQRDILSMLAQRLTKTDKAPIITVSKKIHNLDRKNKPEGYGVARRKKTDTVVFRFEDTPEEAINALRLRFQGEVIEMVPTAEYPFQVLQTEEYKTWADSISDIRTSTRIDVNVDKMQRGLFGDWKIVGDGVFEMRLDFGAGYRVYYARHGAFVVILLAGGDKSDQRKVIADAKRLWKGMKDEITQV